MAEDELHQAEVLELFPKDDELALELERGMAAIGINSMRIDEYGAAVKARTELSRQSPQDAAAQAYLEQAYRAGRSPGWLTCFLLRAVATPESYDLARAILMEHARDRVTPWACVVMSTVNPGRAREDYLAILCDASHQRWFQRSACDALKEIVEPSIVPAVMDAVRNRRLGVARASALLRSLALPSPQLIAWLADSDEAVERMAFAIAMHRDPPETELARALRLALKRGRVRLSPVERARVEEKIARVL